MKKIMLLALAAVCAAVFALPATASAEDIPLHLNPTPLGTQSIDGVGGAQLTSSAGTISCKGFSGNATFDEGGTTGTINLLFGGDCTFGGFTCTTSGAGTGNIATTALPFHLVTLPDESPGVLVTPNADSGVFAHFICGFIPVTVGGNGVIGTITSPECGAVGDEATISFTSKTTGIQDHTKVAGTETVYRLTNGEANAAQQAHGTLTLNEEVELDCT